jgi:hypothetical protein
MCSRWGELFFASSNDLVTQFNYATDPDKVVVDLTSAHIWDERSRRSCQPGRCRAQLKPSLEPICGASRWTGPPPDAARQTYLRRRRR